MSWTRAQWRDFGLNAIRWALKMGRNTFSRQDADCKSWNITLLARVHKHMHTHIRTHNLSLTHIRTGACAHIQARAHTNRCVRTHTQWRTHAHTHVRFWTVNTQSYFWCCGCLLVECVWLMGESKSAHFICTLIEMNSTHDSKADFLDQKVSRTQTHFI